VTAFDIKSALAKSHYLDFFATECKNGPTYSPNGNGLLIFDALAIKKSWTNPDIIIYEIKVSRGDFKRDGKWQCYLPFCHEFYFVVPKGMVKKEEVPEGVGLKYYNPTNGSIRTVKKAVYRPVEINADMLMYIIMNKLDSDRIPFFSDKAEYASCYLENKTKTRNLGHLLGSKMANELSDLQRQVDGMSTIQHSADLVDKILKVLKKHGISIWFQEDIPEKLDEALTREYPKYLDDLATELKRMLDEICRIKENGA